MALTGAREIKRDSRVLAHLANTPGDAQVHQIGAALGLRDRSVARSLDRLTDDGLAVSLDTDDQPLPLRTYRPADHPTTLSIRHVDFHPVIVTATTDHPAAHPALTRPDLRIVRADSVRPGDLIVSAFAATPDGRLRSTDYFACGAYPAIPQPYDPECGCGVCGTPEVEGLEGTVVLSTSYPWESCDPWPADELVLVLPRPDLP
ncbi:hypothetical protein E6W39_06730 [Kitasatospora acidiphila]|uniref:HTH marR-type domain-containing protein n=1 Tax=Kitasatospora acidiphila TaxID=2567942 RepID=A0A540VZ65_9ACTN|nr:MarR family transcriptional regulator [Kitasatospora acidiphila]TQF02027.1 hypothetical protein E6W39_06730 [Kitasatospora acidiphila]